MTGVINFLNKFLMSTFYSA